MTLFVPHNFPQGVSVWYYVFGYNETHSAMPLDYGSLLNHHKNSNTYPFSTADLNSNLHFQVRGIFPYANHMHTYLHHTRANLYIHTYMHYRRMYTHTIFKATKDIAAGQEIFVSYGGLPWFEAKNIPYTDFDYASTRWRPDLQPLPCRKNVIQTILADGRRMYAVHEAVSSGDILEISLCLEVPVVVVDQFPYLWDFVITREKGRVHAG